VHPRKKVLEKIHEIEGLRGVAIIAVILHHLNSEYLPGGYLGGDVFFVILGFVISDLLNKLKLNSTYEYFLIFYVRRIRRLFPALFVFVVVTASFSKLIIDGFGSAIIKTGASALVGGGNLSQIRIGNDYFGLASKFNIFTHTWSLGVEEQFYLIFPYLFNLFFCI
jgi:peptidoglycan/LPS O-acetylase OafA/YrhL